MSGFQAFPTPSHREVKSQGISLSQFLQMSCVCALTAAVPTKAMLAARGPFWVCT